MKKIKLLWVFSSLQNQGYCLSIGYRKTLEHVFILRVEIGIHRAPINPNESIFGHQKWSLSFWIVLLKQGGKLWINHFIDYGLNITINLWTEQILAYGISLQIGFRVFGLDYVL